LGHNPKSASEHALFYCPYDARRHGREKKSSTLPISNEMVACQYPVSSAGYFAAIMAS
jgi:hypothetical protein